MWLAFFQERNLKEYNQNPRYKGKMFQDLNQLARNNRGRTELVDGALPTLTCSSGSIWSKDCEKIKACPNFPISVNSVTQI